MPTNYVGHCSEVESLYAKRQERDGLGWADPVIYTGVRTSVILIEGHKVHLSIFIHTGSENVNT